MKIDSLFLQLIVFDLCLLCGLQHKSTVSSGQVMTEGSGTLCCTACVKNYLATLNHYLTGTSYWHIFVLLLHSHSHKAG